MTAPVECGDRHEDVGLGIVLHLVVGRHDLRREDRAPLLHAIAEREHAPQRAAADVDHQRVLLVCRLPTRRRIDRDAMHEDIGREPIGWTSSVCTNHFSSRMRSFGAGLPSSTGPVVSSADATVPRDRHQLRRQTASEYARTCMMSTRVPAFASDLP